MADMITNTPFKKRWKDMLEELNTWRKHWFEVSEYFFPRKGRYLMTNSKDGNSNAKGEKLGQKIIHPQGGMASRTLAAGLMSGLTSPSRPWFRLAIDDDDLMEYKPVKEWLYFVTNEMFRILRQSNFYDAMRNLYGELGVFGFNAMLMQEDPIDVIRCIPTTIGEAYIKLDNKFRPTTLYRTFVMTVSQLKEEFGEDKLLPQMKEGDRMDDEYQVFHVIEPKGAREFNAPGAKGKDYISVYYLEKGPDDHFLKISGYRTLPFVAPRWDVTGTDTYGDCPGIYALPDVKQLQKMENDKLIGVDKQMNPPMNAPSGMKGAGKSLLPGAINYQDVMQGQQGFTPVYLVTPDLSGMSQAMYDITNRIDQHFFVPLFLAVLNEDKTMTATEVAQRHAEKLQQLGPVIERLETEVLDVIVDRLFDLMKSLGRIPAPPEEIQGKEYTVKYTSLLAQAQQMAGLQSIEQMLGIAAQVAAINPDVLDKIDFDQSMDLYSSILGAPPEMIRSDDEVLELRKQKAEAVQQQQQAAYGSQLAAGAKQLSEAKLEGDSVLDSMLGAV